MLRRIRGALGWGAAQLPTVAILSGLVALAFWGAANDWRLPGLGASATEKKEAARETVQVIPDAPGTEVSSPGMRPLAAMRIEFPSAEAVQRAGVRVAPIKVQTIARFVTANGSIDYEPSRYARLTARATGTVWRMEKEAGDPVKKGEIVALIDAAEVGKAKGDFLQSLTQVRLRTATLQQQQALGQNAAVSQRVVRDADTALREARIRLFNDQQTLLNLGLRVRLKEVETLPDDELALHMRLLGLPESLKKEFDAETLTANLLPVVAPFSGVVVQRFASLGELQQVTQPKPMYVVADISKLHFELDVNPEDIGELRLGQEVTFRPEGATVDAASGRISHITPEVDEKTRKIRVHSEFDNPGRHLRPNTFGTARILISKHADVAVVPADAVQSDGKTHFVLIRQSETTFRPRVVQIGLRDGNMQEVSGVNAGEEVVTTGSFMLKSELLKDKIAGGDD